MLSFFSSKKNIDEGLSKTKKNFWQKLSSIISIEKQRVDPLLISDLEELLLSLDIGMDTTTKIIASVEEKLKSISNVSDVEVAGLLEEEILKIILDSPKIDSLARPYVILVVGVNGVGKTTTVGKIAAKYASQNKKVLLGAADTFRAAAIEQLNHWALAAGVEIISRGANADPSAVVYDTIKRGIDINADVILIDTAGRLHTKIGLMDELSKIRRTIQKLIPAAPHDVILVLDGTTGQNAFVQAEMFTKATSVSSLVITKLDGTAKGGILIGLADKFQLPVRYIGLGEKIEDLQEFNKDTFVKNIFSK